MLADRPDLVATDSYADGVRNERVGETTAHLRPGSTTSTIRLQEPEAHRGTVDRVVADVESEVIGIEIPEGKVLAEMPEKVAMQSEFADYLLDFKMEGNILKITREMRYKKDHVPLEKYNEFSKFFEDVIKSDSRQIAFKNK